MSKYEVSVSAYNHYQIDADSPEEAREKAQDKAESDIGMRWNIDAIEPFCLEEIKRE